jgi:hypothetical protein
VSRRNRLMLTAGAACVAAITGVITAVGYTDSVSGQFGAMRPAVVTTAPIDGGQVFTAGTVRQSTEVRRIPTRFLPIGTLSERAGAIGLEPVVDLPPGSYLASGFLRLPGREKGRSGRAVMAGLHPVEVTVQGAGAIPPGGGRFDVLLTPVGIPGRKGRTRLVARSAPIVTRAVPDTPTSGGGPVKVTLAVPRSEAVRLIDAEARGERLTLLASVAG